MTHHHILAVVRAYEYEYEYGRTVLLARPNKLSNLAKRLGEATIC